MGTSKALDYSPYISSLLKVELSGVGGRGRLKSSCLLPHPQTFSLFSPKYYSYYVYYSSIAFGNWGTSGLTLGDA